MRVRYAVRWLIGCHNESSGLRPLSSVPLVVYVRVFSMRAPRHRPSWPCQPVIRTGPPPSQPSKAVTIAADAATTADSALTGSA